MLNDELGLQDQIVRLNEPTTFFAQMAKLNDSAMIEYGIDDETFGDRRVNSPDDNQGVVLEGNQ